MKKLIKIKDIEKELKEELIKDQEEIIEFDYRDKINNQTVVIKDKRKIKVLLMQLDLEERKQRDEIQREECSYNAKTDDVYAIDNKTPEQIMEEKELEDEEIKLSKESQVYQKMNEEIKKLVDKNVKNEESRKKVKEIFIRAINSLTEKQLNIAFMVYYLDLSQSEISRFFNVSRQLIHKQIKEIEQILRKSC